jgi:signal transduction histidine kinase
VNRFAQQFTTQAGGEVAIFDRSGNNLAPASNTSLDDFAAAIRRARAGQPATGEINGLAYVVEPVGANAGPHGAVLVARPDGSVDHRVRLFWLALVGIGVAVLGASTLMSRRLARWAVDPLDRLERHAMDLGHGELTVRSAITAGPPEVIALARTFNEMAAQLDELVSSQRRFVADASHQLRTPLTALRLRLENLDPDDPTLVAATRDAALQESARLTRVVDGLLVLARAEGHRPEREPVDVASVLEQRREAWGPLAAERGVDLRHQRNGHATAAIVPEHLEQILDNLIDNALDATPPGRAVVLRHAQNHEGIEIHVTDEGRGMTDAEREHAFDPFWRSTEGQDGHTGLGLAIVEQLTRASGGTATLERAHAGGLDAVVRFPAAK